MLQKLESLFPYFSGIQECIIIIVYESVFVLHSYTAGTQ